MPITARTFAAITLSALSASCSDETLPVDPAPPVAVACDVHAGGVAEFAERTVEWGLSSPRIDGVLLASGDLNGDGYPDLITHLPSPNQREVIGVEPRLMHVLMNEPRPGGGRVFVDRTDESGYGATVDGSTTEHRSASLAVIGDVDNDGDPDLFSGNYSFRDLVQTPSTPADLDRSEILLNDGTGHFTLAPPSGVQTADVMSTAGASFTDVNQDGRLDLFLVHWFRNSNLTGTSPQRLLLGNGDGTFNDISMEAGVSALTTRRPGFGSTVCDLDGDGGPELLMSSYARTPNVLYRSDAPGHYTDVALPAGFAYDENESYQDDQFYRCYCSVHAADAYCTSASAPQVVCPTPADAYWLPGYSDQPENLGGNTFTTLCSDVDGDGDLDLYNTEIAHWWAGESSDLSELLVNESDASGVRFARPGRDATGLAWEHVGIDWNEGGLYAAGEDFDQDGRQDILVGATDYADQYGLYFHQRRDGTFEEIGEASGFHHPCAGALSVADFDRDGDLDIVTGSNRYNDCSDIWDTNEVHFYENVSTNRGHWLLVKLVGDGVTANATGIGARVTVDANGVKLLKELGGGYGHLSMQHDTVLFFGLGACAVLHAIEVTWPDAARTTERFENVVADRMIEIRQGQAEVRDVTPKTQ